MNRNPDYIRLAIDNLATMIAIHAEKTGCMDGEECEQLKAMQEAVKELAWTNLKLQTVHLHRTNKTPQ